jgi:tRNA nucleotidyltransferase (CCA-adding enzyme)
MLKYPDKLNIIFDKLEKLNIKPLIIGGYVRDFLLHIPSKDIDIEIYGVDSFNELEKILAEFGDVNSVGKSFGVCKLHIDDLELDFSLPRSDSKNNNGHKGFQVTVNPNLDFITATSRRDFTINAIAFDIQEKKFLDPFHGKKDLNSKIIKAVCLEKFAEDPLRILRAVGFATRLEFTIEKNLFNLLKKMIQNKLLDELPQERIFMEIEKVLLKSSKSSHFFNLLRDLNEKKYFNKLFKLNKKDYDFTMNSIDKCKEKKLDLLLAILVHKLQNPEIFLLSLTNNKKLIYSILKLVENQKSIDLKSFTTYDVYKLAQKVDISSLIPFLKAVEADFLQKEILKLEKISKKLGVYQKKLTPLVQGKDLIHLGLNPSQKFSFYLNEVYEAQMKEKFLNKEEALKWIKSIIFT